MLILKITVYMLILMAKNISNLIGYRGATINSLQVLATAIANKYSTSKTIVIVDVCNYKEKGKRLLEELAEKNLLKE